jgi:hypothetical protein
MFRIVVLNVFNCSIAYRRDSVYQRLTVYTDLIECIREGKVGVVSDTTRYNQVDTLMTDVQRIRVKRN